MRRGVCFTLIVLGLWMLGGGRNGLSATGEDTWRCTACHAEELPGEVPENHRAYASIFLSWRDSDHLDSFHRENGVMCSDCHRNYEDPYEARETQNRCTGCHGDYDELARKTDGASFSANPHESHYIDLKCSLCHKGHSTFVDFCAECHSFGFSWEKSSR